MKKTLITLLALAGVSMGDITSTQLNTWMNQYNANNLVGGNVYELDLVLGTTTFGAYGAGVLLTLNTENWQLHHQIGQFVGLGLNAGPNGSYDSRYSNDDVTIDLSEEYAKVSEGGASTGVLNSGWFLDTGGMNNISGLTINIRAVSGLTTIKVGNGTRTITLEHDGYLKYGDMEIGNSSSLNFKSAAVRWYNGETLSGSASILEPTTATLSLLALAALAARRRRK